ncbi:hypothetical protein BGP82_26500 [Pseudomonas putida]|uniref:Phage tail protein n=1 Tax=Pseudomonas putida TaxID=303 RepID=A0A2S3WLF8_PSEPU|nr:phage tail assembly chaperone [Pseudomonas putida]POG00999.1 hypothetical protein BGP82_26500 [Pseudomonas putida]
MLFSKSTGAFYVRAVHGNNMPPDVVEITMEEYGALLDGQQLGKVIAADTAGRPVLQSASPEQLAAIERDWRDEELAALQWLRERHRDEVDLGRLTTLTAEQFIELLGYLQALRDWPQADAFPDQWQRPKELSWIQEQIR